VTDARLREIARRVLEIEAGAIAALVAKLDERFPAAVHLLRRCTGRVIVTGMGKSGLIGRKIAATLASTGTPAYFLHPAEGVHGDLGMLARGDVVLALSNSGETDELLAIVPAVKRLGVPVVLLTGRPDSPLARVCEVVIDVAVSEEACPMNLAPTSSTTAALAMGDAIAMALLELRELRPEDYAALHPRGALGWRSVMRVADLMHTGEALPIVAADALMKDVIEEMTRKQFGMTTVVDHTGALVGVITDGDLRRLLLRGESMSTVRAAEAATRTPKTIAAEAMAAHALEVMESSGPITSLVVVDAAGRPAGIVRMHDIVRAKIV
jgi:arabinose-5-phosphate isomerase